MGRDHPEDVRCEVLDLRSQHTVILLSDYVPPDAIDRQRLKARVYGLRDRAIAKQTASNRKQGFIIVGLIVTIAAIAAIVSLTP